MSSTSGSPRLLAVVNLAVLVGAFAALFWRRAVPTGSPVIYLAGAAVVVFATALTYLPRTRTRWLRRPHSPVLRTTLAVAPWLLLLAFIAANGLWWTQRPGAVRFFLLYAIANWSAAVCLSGERSANPWKGGPRRAVTVLAIGLAALGVQGAAFGVTLGCAVSAALAAVGVFAFAIACFGGRSAQLKVFAASAAALTAIVVLEAAVRIQRIGQNVQEIDDRELARQFYSLTPPGSAFVNDPKPLDEFGPALIEINSLGVRGPELTDSRADVLLIGDSMIEARQLPWEETLGPQLQQAVRARRLPHRVVAHGMRGWSPLLEWNWYLKVGRRLQPKVVLLFFFWNDLWTTGDEVSTFGAELDAHGRPKEFTLPVDSNWIWYKHVRLVRVIGDVWRRLSVAEVRRAFRTVATSQTSRGTLDDRSAEHLTRTLTTPPLTAAEIEDMLSKPEHELTENQRRLFKDMFWPSLRPTPLWTDAQRASASHTELNLKRFAEDVRSDGGRFVIVYVPNPLQVGGNECALGRLFARVDSGVVLPPESGIQSWLRTVSERHAIELLDPSDEMLQFNTARPPRDTAALYLRADCHWSARGHRFMAEYLADWIQRTGGAESVSGRE